QAPTTTTTQPPTTAAGPSFDVPGITPIITPNEDFYVVDTTLSPPRVDLDKWTLKVTGMVRRPYEISFAELLTRPVVERYVTLACVSNRVGGSLVGHAKWLGVPLSHILDEAGLLSGAEQVVGRAVDGFTVGFPSTIPYDGRDALVAVGMNGEPLPIRHGFPARLVVAGLYGYVSATKWLSELELTTWNGFDAYWVPRGWAKKAPVKTQSRIDTPRDGSRIGTGNRYIAGVAWAPHRGIDRVEVQVGDGPWLEAELSAEISDNSWRQWRVWWDPLPGSFLIRVRATDGRGATQTDVIRPPAPDGATGWHTIAVTVSG
ncbi:MAG: molybdopterin-dependent oxidoreductase, partial [bacterium]|nr:molybdopterin-dependent oxidoreductase [bacterium]